MKIHAQPMAILATFLLAFCACSAAAEQGQEYKDKPAGYGPKTEQERLDAKQIDLEDKRQVEKDGEFQLTTLDGKVYMDQGLNPKTLPWVVGKFASKGRAYSLLLDDPGLYERLKLLNAKTARYSGRIRCNGKYFIVTSIYQPLGVSSSRPKRGGM